MLGLCLIMTVSTTTISKVMAELGARGGKQKTTAQSKARAKNMEKARKARSKKARESNGTK